MATRKNLYERAMLVNNLHRDIKKIADKIREMSAEKRSLSQKLDIAIGDLKNGDNYGKD